MRAVVTGGAGFLGSHLCDRLLERDYEVVCLDNLLTGNTSNIAHLMGHSNFKFIKYNVIDYLFVEGPVDAVLHFASPASPIDYLEMPIQTLKVGSLGTHKALGLAKEKKARFLLASTSEVYGDPLVNPQPETYWGNVNPIGPRGVYDEAKRFAEAITMAYRRYHKMDARIARIFNTYGPRMRPNDGRVVSNFIVQALGGSPLTIYGNGSQTRSFCYVSDLIGGILSLLAAPPSNEMGQPFNIGNPEERTVRDLATKILALAGSSSPVVYQELPVDDPHVRCPDIRRAKSILGWRPEVSIDEGLQLTIDYFRGVAS
ncbi:MAG: NAD-dependent dehydratase [Acidobacteria bacterium 13_1_20CM_2_55_15]|nr:MAG: NAD-dependent dehydratase [Acidobacteria bacterium 13_1_40CM_56_16]OLD16735.1 MAG: NAD-dependent dehydratase [Acidobacteria bacterium 13_1_40CM_3_56_11]OLD70619.1 MAG: NAD-dependent dehydratase [Acidobacteria bacterium 13_1_40CM_2_56_11]OLE89031.1 MAG: NAD-dependent dehydratase [Acidobacteria bacterium 13_1_20CM_2_55_15]PYS18006.1 MAG: NAD-dependent dehydratase [Acidobacteriota bacterium]